MFVLVGYQIIHVHMLGAIFRPRGRVWSLNRSPARHPLFLSRTRALPAAPVNLLLQHDAVHAGLEQRKGQARLALELAQPVEDLGRGVGREAVERRGELCGPVGVSRRSLSLVCARSGNGDGGRTCFMLLASRSYSSRTSCSRGVSSGGERRLPVVLCSMVAGREGGRREVGSGTSRDAWWRHGWSTNGRQMMDGGGGVPGTRTPVPTTDPNNTTSHSIKQHHTRSNEDDPNNYHIMSLITILSSVKYKTKQNPTERSRLHTILVLYPYINRPGTPSSAPPVRGHDAKIKIKHKQSSWRNRNSASLLLSV